MRKDPRFLRRLLSIAAAVSTLAFASPGRAASCEDMLNLKLPNTVIKSAQRFGRRRVYRPGHGQAAGSSCLLPGGRLGESLRLIPTSA